MLLGCEVVFWWHGGRLCIAAQFQFLVLLDYDQLKNKLSLKTIIMFVTTSANAIYRDVTEEKESQSLEVFQCF